MDQNINVNIRRVVFIIARVKIINTIDVMDKLMEEQAEKFGQYVCQELKGAITARGFSQQQVAHAIHKDPSVVSKWLNGNPIVPIRIAVEICSYIGVELTDIVHRADQRVKQEYQSDAEFAHDIIAHDMTLAAYTDPDKHREAHGEQY